MTLRHKKYAVLSLLIFVQTVLLSVLAPFLIGKILGALGTAPEMADNYILPLILVAIAGVVTNYVGFKAFFTLQPKVMSLLENEALETLLRRSVGFHNNHVGGKLVTDATQYASSYGQLVDAFVVNVIPFAITVLVGAGIVLWHSLALGILVIVMTASILAIAIWQTVSKNAEREERHAARRVMTAHMADTITNSQNVKIFAREPVEMSTHRTLSNRLMKFRNRDWQRIARDGSQRIGALLTFQIIFVVIILQLVQRDPELLGIGIFAFSYAITLFNRLFEIGNLFRRIEDSLLDASDMIRIIYEEPEVLDAPGATTLKVAKGEVSFSGVRFHYSDVEPDDAVFEKLDLTIPAGQKVGLVGPSGGGKSTLSRLLLRFEDIQAGTIAVDGQSIAAVTQSSLREAIAYVPQEPLLFHRTVAENIAYGKDGASQDRIEKAARQAHAYDFIMALPKGFNTVVGERGVKLSGGQRQRIAIARAILKDAPILVLDEATSALDSESEAAIQSALSQLMHGRTTIVIAHRLSTIQQLDRIIVLEDGKIKEDGSHEQLRKAKGLYARLWKRQSGGFIEE